jgi:hypothetical protein
VAWYDIFLGGMGKSTNPSDYYTPYHDQGQIQGAINQGLGTNHQMPTAQANDPFRQAQLQQMQQLQGIASGQQMGAGELAAQRQGQNALAQQQAMARMTRGAGAGQAQLMAARNAGNIGLATAGQSQQAALQDQMNAQGLLTNAMGQGRGQDLQSISQQLQLMGMNDQTRLAYLQQLTGMDATQLQAQLGAMQATTQQQGLLGPLLSAGGQVGAAALMSDENVKTDISDARHEVDEMLDQLLPKAYVYKDQSKHGIGRRVGIMAQDLRKSKAGADVTIDTPDGIGLDINKAISAALASSARLNERVRDLEKKAG